MSKTPDNSITAALTFKVPQKVGWSAQRKDQSWTGNDLDTLLNCIARETRNNSVTLSLSLIFELTGNEGTVRSLVGTPPGDG